MGACCYKCSDKLCDKCCKALCCKCCHILCMKCCGHKCPKNCCRCKCGPKKTRCCHCRIGPKIPDTDDINVEETVNSKEYNSWLQHSQPIEGRKWFYWITFYVDLYCWLLIAGYALGIFVAHLIPALHCFYHEIALWNTCALLDDPSTLSWSCVLVIHLMEGTCMIGAIACCIYILHQWNFEHLDLFEKLLVLTNIITLAMFLFEGSLTWITFIRDSLWYQSYSLFALSFLLCFGVILGVFIQYNVCPIFIHISVIFSSLNESTLIIYKTKVFVFLRQAKNWTTQYPKTESEIVSLVLESSIDKGKIRVVGSKHSAPPAIYVDNILSLNQIMMSLDLYTGVKITKIPDNEIKEVNQAYNTSYNIEDDEKGVSLITHRAVARAGTCLGLNRENPHSKMSNGLVYILQDNNLSLEDLGGVVMQTVGGFTSMGCAGGGIYHDYCDSIYSIRWIDGLDKIHTTLKPTIAMVREKGYVSDYGIGYTEYTDYWGVIVSMGLYGIISEVTYNLKANYNVLGSQILWPIKKDLKDPIFKYPISWLMNRCVPERQDGDNTGSLDIYAENDDPDSLYQLIMNPENKHKTEYLRLFAWPQVDPNLVTVWKGHVETRNDYQLQEWKDNFGGKDGKEFKPIYYHEVGDPQTGKGGVIEQRLLSFLYNFFDHFTNVNSMELPGWAVKIIKLLIKAANPDSMKPKNQMYFGASWADILPMDQEMWTKLMPFQFTELWFDIEDTDKVMKILKEYWADNEGLKHSGTFSWEFYPGKEGGYGHKHVDGQKGGAWLRPSFGRTSFRVDVLWFDVKTQIPYDFFTPLWNKFVKEGVYFRPHWAKWFPGGNVEFPVKDSKYKMWRDYYCDQYPMWDTWKSTMTKYDPNRIFLSTYWADTLGINVNEPSDPFYAVPPSSQESKATQEKATTDAIELGVGVEVEVEEEYMQ